ncbi:MAG: diacylglycerol kinase [Thiohalomonadales bacterium]|nr:diacylglycerol kinase [Thiohalomonadales bacterium]
MGKTGVTGLQRIINAFGYSMKGLWAAFKHESAFRQETALLIILLPIAILLGQNIVDYSILIGSLFLVIIVELLNSAVEAVVDRVGDEHNKLAGRAKDMGSAAVFISLVNVIVIWSMYCYQFFMHQ